VCVFFIKIIIEDTISIFVLNLLYDFMQLPGIGASFSIGVAGGVEASATRVRTGAGLETVWVLRL
jgi:hypothetical protein